MIAQRLLTVAILAGLGLLEVGAVRTMAADAVLARLGAGASAPPTDTLLRAAAWRPDVADYWRRAADSAAFDHPEQARGYAEKAVALAPTDWQSWSSLALIELQLGQTGAANQAMQHAVAFDHSFDARYQLASMDLLLGNMPAYWQQIRAALAIAPPERIPEVLQEAYGVSRDPDRLLTMLPPGDSNLHLEATGFFLDHGLLAPAFAAWQSVSCARSYGQTCITTAINLTNALLSQASRFPETQTETVGEAENVWNGAVGAGVFTASRAEVANLGDRGFRQPWLGPNFSWEESGAVPLTLGAPPPGQGGEALQIVLSGGEPESCDLFDGYVLVVPGQTYQLQFLSRFHGQAGTKGLAWRLATDPGATVAVAPIALGSAWTPNRITFQAPPRRSLLHLTLTYQRPEGDVRLIGTANVYALALTPITAGAER